MALSSSSPQNSTAQVATDQVGNHLPADPNTVVDGTQQDTQADTEDLAPYVVFAAKENAFARSGPGEDHYRTDPLRRGQELEVYVETADGWLGIRPPEKSFCWIPAKATDWREGDELAVIAEDETIAWIGTRLGSARRYRWQVELSEGEEVTILGTADRSGDQWLRISPPSGEFRWVHLDDIAETAEELVQIAESEARKNLEAVKEDSVEDLVPRASMPGTVARAASESAAETDSFKSAGQSIVQTGNLGSITSTPTSLSEIEASNSLSSRRGSRTETLSVAGDMPALQPVPESLSAVPDRAIQLHRGVDVEDFEDRGAVIGSGLRQDWMQADELTETGASVPASQRVAAAAEVVAAPIRKVTDIVANFISPPRLIEIDGTRNQFAGDQSSYVDRRWMVGGNRPLPSATPQASLAAPIVPGNTLQAGYATAPKAARVVPLAKISQVEDAVSDASVDSLNRVLSRLMAEAASASEVEPVIRRANAILNSGDVNSTGLARDLLQTAQQYRVVAARRDGPTRIDTSPVGLAFSQTSIGGSALTQASATQRLDPSGSIARGQGFTTPATVPSTPAGPPEGSAVGTLVRVYTSRANMPPYVLTDDAGLTVAYVTPYPGVSLQSHLNSRIAVKGNQKLLQGMATPHILVDEVVRR